MPGNRNLANLPRTSEVMNVRKEPTTALLNQDKSLLYPKSYPYIH